jgi:predicted acetyltransferase
MGLTIRKATHDDIDSLTEMNKHLIEDEGSRNPMNFAQLKERMMKMLDDIWKILVISQDGEEIGYMVYKVTPDEYFPEKSELYIRQYFVKRNHRSNGIGAEAFNKISSEYFPEEAVWTLDVLEVNPKGRRFWEKVGFKPYLTHMKKQKSS